MISIATWNINGIRARLETLTSWLEQAKPDIACLQEIKSEDDKFPAGDIEALGYNLKTHGQKGFNGVAILSKLPFDEIATGLPGGDDDNQSRFVEAVFSLPNKSLLRVASIYLPNGNPVGGDKFRYKLDWMARLEKWASERMLLEEPLVMAGDFNVIPEPWDCYDPEAWEDDALYQPESRAALRRIVNLGLTDAVRACTDAAGVYTFWDYQAGAWQKNNGIRIDHLLLSPEASDRLEKVEIDKHVRAWEKPSDHVPVTAWLSV